MKTKEIHDDMDKTLGKGSPCSFTVKKWVADFKRGRQNTDDDTWTGRPKAATTDTKMEGIIDGDE